MARKPETIFRQYRVVPFLKTLKNTVRFPIQQVAYSGHPDFIMCVDGRFVALELKKSDKDEPSPLQKQFHREIRRTGGKVFVACPENWNIVKQQLSNLDKGEGYGKKLRIENKVQND